MLSPGPPTAQERFEEKYAASVAPRVAEEAAVTRYQQEEARRRHRHRHQPAT